MSSLQEFRDYVTNSGVNFDILTIEQKREWRETFDRSRPPAPVPGISQEEIKGIVDLALANSLSQSKEAMKGTVDLAVGPLAKSLLNLSDKIQEADFPILPYGQFPVWYHSLDAWFSTATAISNNGQIKCSHIQSFRLLPSFLGNSLDQLVNTCESYLYEPELCPADKKLQ
mmetsp:Transcript_26831/g.38322  ORF Transcript_26831/g.38322 Transcript_26831/m.38322 type:complete len:171 (+) Transcript_26831:68-580(+)